MIKFGMPTLIETETPARCVEICHELGLKFIELNMNFPQFQPWIMDVSELKRLAEDNHIFYTIHLDDDMSAADFNPYVAESYRKTAVQTINFAKQLELPVLNMHLSMGAVYTLPERKVYFFGEYLQQYLENMRRFRDVCTEAIGDSGIRICVENTKGFTDFHKKAIEVLLESPVFGLTLDIGHNYCCNNADEPWILNIGENLHHMHMHDAKNRKNDHLCLGAGEIDIPRYIRMADEHDCTVVLETKTEPGLRGSVRWLREHRYL